MSAIDTARAAWGEDMPEWVAALATECGLSSQNKVAARLGRSAAVVSMVLRKKYSGDLAGVEELFNGAFRSATVDCPALGEVPANECRHWRDRARTFAVGNPTRTRMYRACRCCPRFRPDEASDEMTASAEFGDQQ